MENIKENLSDKNKIIKVKTDIPLIISTGASRKSIKWKVEQTSWASLVNRLSNTIRTKETQKEYNNSSKADKDRIKDVGGFVGGPLKNGRRKNENIANRSVLTLDLDHINTTADDIWDAITMFYGCELCVYSTHSHTPEKPRLRLVIPFDTPVFSDEYQAIARRIAADIGIDYFDDTTYEASRLMYWPSTSLDAEFYFKYQDGNLLDTKKVLDTYLDWRDVAFWPTSSRHENIIDRQMKKQEDPLEKSGLIGAFCRTYTIEEAIEKYLSDVYTPTKIKDRYTYAKGSTVGGVVIYDHKFSYSHHDTDPTSNTLCNAFDLVRIHLYGAMDEDAKPGTPVAKLPSFVKMTKEIKRSKTVKKQLGIEKLKEADSDFFSEAEAQEVDTAWLEELEYNKKGAILNTINNVLLILNNDYRIKGKLVYDSFSNRAIVRDNAPWTTVKKEEHDWSDNDDSGLRLFLENNYQITTIQKIDDAKNLIFDKHRYNPVKEYLDGLVWDGVNRIETIFSDYLGAENSLYTREVAKIHLAAAVTRIYRPGAKYDTMVTLSGPQGMGKSTFIYKLSMGWYSDSLDTVRGKEAAELIQGVWHVEMGELNATKKSDRDAVKAFLSKQHDIYRVAYAKNTSRFPRQCVFWGTTNDNAFLRDPTGDRRTFPIDCMENKPKKSIFEDLDKELDQIWAEAIVLVKNGIDLYLKGEAAEQAKVKQMEHKEDIPLAGLIAEYLNKLYPSEWPDMDLIDRQGFLNGTGDTFTTSVPDTQKDRVCVMEIWCELLGKRPGDLKPINSREINDILRGMPGWKQSKSQLSFGKIYGQQRAFIRK